jgi:hypothetical protein
MSEPLTDEELLRALALVERGLYQCDSVGPLEAFERIVPELRRLRSDAWLERAVEDVVDSLAEPPWRGMEQLRKALAPAKDIALEIMRRHRDGKA